MRRLLWVPLVVLAATPVSADSLGIRVLSSTHSANVSTVGAPFQSTSFDTVTSSRTDDAPVSDSLLRPLAQPFHFLEALGATAEANLFDVGTSTAALQLEGFDMVFANAVALTTIDFMPVTTGLATLDILFTRAWSSPWWSEANVQLTDLTTDALLWRYGWDFWLPPARDPARRFDKLPWSADGLTYAAETAFDASHQYRLSLFTHTHANHDSELITAQVQGLREVPEPSTLTLLAAGAWLLRRQRRRTHRAS